MRIQYGKSNEKGKVFNAILIIEMLKISLAQLNYRVGDFEGNLAKIIDAIAKAKLEKTELIIFSELAVCGYPPLDLLEYDWFINRCGNAIQAIAEKCENITAIVGCPSRNKNAGKKLHNSAYVLSNGKIENVIHKTLLPDYDVFDEARYFESNNIFNTINVKGTEIALTICEDIWNFDENKIYKNSPLAELIKNNPAFVINIAASPFDHTKHLARLKVVQQNIALYNLPIVYVNQIGAQTDLIFDGGSLVTNGKGEVVKQLNYFEEDLFSFDTFLFDYTGSSVKADENKTELIYKALVLGIKDYFKKLGFKKAILGLSGGIDSALVAVLAVEALGSENVKGLLMPSEFSSEHSIKDAEKLANNLKIEYEIIPIKNTFDAFENSLKKSFEGLSFNIAEENIQARIRGILLMAQSNKFGNVLLNTTNKSEAAVGYGTLYGDMCGGLAVLADVYKMEVYELANYINKAKEIIPDNTITKAPSAELRPDQKDSDSLPEYEVLDKILYEYIENKNAPDKIIAQGFDKTIVDRVIKLVNINEYKRFQMAPVLRVSPKAFGYGRKMPLEGKYEI